MKKRHGYRHYTHWKIEWKGYEQLYANTFESLDEIDKFPKKHNLPKWIKVERENVNSLIIIIREIESILKTFFTKKI